MSVLSADDPDDVINTLELAVELKDIKAQIACVELLQECSPCNQLQDKLNLAWLQT